MLTATRAHETELDADAGVDDHGVQRPIISNNNFPVACVKVINDDTGFGERKHHCELAGQQRNENLIGAVSHIPQVQVNLGARVEARYVFKVKAIDTFGAEYRKQTIHEKRMRELLPKTRGLHSIII